AAANHRREARRGPRGERPRPPRRLARRRATGIPPAARPGPGRRCALARSSRGRCPRPAPAPPARVLTLGWSVEAGAATIAPPPGARAAAEGWWRMNWQSEMDELRRREAFAEELGGPERVKRQHEGGRYTIRERIEGLVDPGSFHEIGKIAGRAV